MPSADAYALDGALWVEWVEPFGPASEPVFCRVRPVTAIARQRAVGRARKRYDGTPDPYEYGSDADAFADFCVVHFGVVIRAQDGEGDDDIEADHKLTKG